MVCKGCKKEKELIEFNSYVKKDKLYYTRCKLCISEYCKLYKKEINPEAYKKAKKNHVISNPKYYSEYQKNYQNKRRNNDSLFRISGLLRTTIYRSFKNRKLLNKESIKLIVGLDSEKLRIYLLSTKPENVLEKDCHIDHIIPLKEAFEIKDEIERYNKLLELNYYTNLRLISASENLKKGSKRVIE